MPIYHVYGHVAGTKYLGRFQGVTEAEAIEEALESDAAHISLCHQCSTIEVEIVDATAERVQDMKKGKK